MELLQFKEIAEANNKQYFNQIVSNVNDHVVRMGVMTSQYPWHKHPDSDETFIGVEGIVIIETPDAVFELTPGSCITIPKDLIHRTRPKFDRSVNLTVESKAMTTILVADIVLDSETEDNIR
jgi:mannose-6-phosphate isomerase-like protein (cupin superfamily)